MPVALVTGATGLIGSHLVERLLADGWTVRALVRDPGQASWLTATGADPLRGDLLDAAVLIRAARGADAIFHTAAAIFPRGGWEGFRVPNIEGTRNVIASAEESGARLLHLSSVAVYGGASRYRGDGEPTDEQSPFAPLAEDAWYARSKRESEALVMNAVRTGRIWASAIRPCVVYGRRDRQFIPRTAKLLSRGIAPSLRGGRSIISIVHAANVADAVVRAAKLDIANGKAYNATNDYSLTVREFVHLAAEGLGRRVRLIPMPYAVTRGAGKLATSFSRALGRGSSFSPSTSIDFISRDNPFSSELAVRELGWAPPVHPRHGVPEAFRWWRENEKGTVE